MTDWNDKVRNHTEVGREVRRALAERERLESVARRLQQRVDSRTQAEVRQVALRKLEEETGAVLAEISYLRISEKLTEIRDQIWLEGGVDLVLRAHLSWGIGVRFEDSDDAEIRSFRAYGYQLSCTHQTLEGFRSQDSSKWSINELFTIDRLVVLYHPISEPGNRRGRPHIEIFTESLNSTNELSPAEAPVRIGHFREGSPYYLVYTDERHAEELLDFYLADICHYMMNNRLLPGDMRERQTRAKSELERLVELWNNEEAVAGEDRPPPLLGQVFLRWLL